MSVISTSSENIQQHSKVHENSTLHKSPQLEVLGINFHPVTMDKAVALIENSLGNPVTNHVVLANAHTVAVCWKDALLRKSLDQAELVLADGMSIVWGARWVGVRLPERVAGPDLAERLCERAALCGYRLFFLGSTPEALAELKTILLARWPSLSIVGQYSPPMCDRINDEENKRIFSAIAAATPDILFVGMSMPKQEKWIAEHKSHLHVPVAIGIGAAFDFLSGRIPRAPIFFQRLGLEWAYRLYCEPRRLWRRYLLGNTIFVTHLTWAFLRHKARRLIQE
jgi:N-acetylglucosaminyldiphosphoundecaprenol N-acetyl-beta-D-mannosaminyltransferase